MQQLKAALWSILLLLTACNASDSVSHYEDTDSATGPRISKEHQLTPPVKDTARTAADTAHDSISRRSISPPGATDTTKLNIQ